VTGIDHVLIDREWSIRVMNTWEAPSLIFRLSQKEKRLMRDLFDLRWSDVDIHIKFVEECRRDGIALGKRLRKERGVQLVYGLTKTPGGYEVVVDVLTLFNEHGAPIYMMPSRDEEGRFIEQEVGTKNVAAEGEEPRLEPVLERVMEPAKLSLIRLFPVSHVDELFAAANAGMVASDAFIVAMRLKRSGNEKSYAEMIRSFDHFLDLANGTDKDTLTATAEEMAENKRRQQEKSKKKGGKKPKIGAPTLAEGSAEVPAQASTETVPDATPVAPAPAPAPKKEKIRPAETPPRPSLADQVAAVRDQVLPGTPDGSNGQSS
jgi:hypothetical protein